MLKTSIKTIIIIMAIMMAAALIGNAVGYAAEFTELYGIRGYNNDNYYWFKERKRDKHTNSQYRAAMYYTGSKPKSDIKVELTGSAMVEDNGIYELGSYGILITLPKKPKVFTNWLLTADGKQYYNIENYNHFSDTFTHECSVSMKEEGIENAIYVFYIDGKYYKISLQDFYVKAEKDRVLAYIEKENKEKLKLQKEAEERAESVYVYNKNDDIDKIEMFKTLAERAKKGGISDAYNRDYYSLSFLVFGGNYRSFYFDNFKLVGDKLLVCNQNGLTFTVQGYKVYLTGSNIHYIEVGGKKIFGRYKSWGETEDIVGYSREETKNRLIEYFTINGRNYTFD